MMRQFLSGNVSAFAELEMRARQACIVFPDQEMPVGSWPETARVGFEITNTDGAALLLVDRGVVCPRAGEEVRAWLEAGERRFADFEQLRHWITGALAPAYRQTSNPGIAPQSSTVGNASTLRVENLTDLSAIQSQIPEVETPLRLDEETLYRELSSQVRGQEAPLRLLAHRVCLHAARCTPQRPASLFAIGPTGVGKTRTVEVLQRVLREMDPNGVGYGYLRLDMSEYSEPHRVSQLLGAPPGYIGYGEGSPLSDALIASPKTIVLFDEIEKAHPSILKTVMNLMDAGRLSAPTPTGGNREIDGRAAILIFTSNLDATDILKELDRRDNHEDATVVDETCRKSLRRAGIAPELIGRISRFLVFSALSNDVRAEVVTLAVARVAAEYGLQLERIEPDVIVSLLRRLPTTEFGTRPIEYTVDDLLGSTFAQTASTAQGQQVELHGGPPYKCVLRPLESESTNGQ